MLDELHPVGEQDCSNSRTSNDGEQHSTRDDSCYRAARTAFPRVETSQPEYRTDKQNRAEDERHMVSRRGYETDGDALDERADVGFG